MSSSRFPIRENCKSRLTIVTRSEAGAIATAAKRQSGFALLTSKTDALWLLDEHDQPQGIRFLKIVDEGSILVCSVEV